MTGPSFDSPGAGIDVYWGNAAGSLNQTKDVDSWFQGAIVAVEKRKIIQELHVATIRYRPVAYFPFFHQEVLVSDTTKTHPTLRCIVTGALLYWRWSTTTRPAGSDLWSEGGLGARKRRRVYSGVRARASSPDVLAARRRRSCEEDFSDDLQDQGGSGYVTRSLESRVQYLEAAMLLQRDALSKLHEGVRYEALANHERPLMYLRMRLNVLLQRSPPALKLRRRDGDGCIIADNIRCQSDCSLAEFENLCLHVLSTPSDKVVLRPPCTVSDIPRLREDELSIHFVALKDLLRLLGITSDTIIAQTVLKTGRGRRRKSPVSACRVLGQLLCPGIKEPEPMCVSIAHVITDSLYRHIPEKVPVLLREDTTWINEDKEYENDLSLELVEKSYCRKLQTDIRRPESPDDPKPRGKSKKKKTGIRALNARNGPSFSLSWERCTAQHGRNLLCSPNSAHQVSGRLRVEIPAVIIRDQYICREILELWSVDKVKENI